jgi:hypothetical protein
MEQLLNIQLQCSRVPRLIAFVRGQWDGGNLMSVKLRQELERRILSKFVDDALVAGKLVTNKFVFP